ncbi:hypothetical protein CYMTET_51093 [Cymbomonas tetramitiformis]|uniref:PiggyBac transposable element-derived protein domain-containing protein n=1 Tax=Cymbomonas tetramitiformis TaxID=36881 RepID=A0AAE0BLV9_9CHLO|nr:hypothetical protein CYMTET_51093 [Cymbomonas tetramitiformis]
MIKALGRTDYGSLASLFYPSGTPVLAYTGPEVGCPSAKADRLLDPFVSEPLDYFNAFIPEVERHNKWKQHSNVYATTQGASTDKYPNFKPFSAAEIDINVGLLIRNGLSPVPDFRYNFTPPSSNFVFGDDRVIAALPGGYGRYKEFRAFFHLQDPRLAEPPDQPFWKLKPIFDVVRTNSEELWYLGKHVSLDEQDCGFQGRSALKDKIKFKKEGDGFLADCICEGGYTWTFHFRRDPLPISSLEKDAADLHNRCLMLLERFPFDWNCVWMDNLFISRRFMQWGYKRNVLMVGVARASGRGVPDSVVQVEAKTVGELARVAGTVKVARTADFKILAASIYDNKPVHVLTSIHNKVDMVEKVRKIWDVTESRKRDLEYNRLNVIDDYNNNMNGVDIADQLRNQYRLDGPWMRQRKWWFALFLWALGVATVNAYLLYRRQCQLRGVDEKKVLNHLEFNTKLAESLCFGEGNLVAGEARGRTRVVIGRKRGLVSPTQPPGKKQKENTSVNTSKGGIDA